MKKLFVIAGEASGDLHASNLLKALKKNAPYPMEISAIGGDKMKNQGAFLVEHIKNTQFMGFVQVVKNLGKIRKLFKLTKQHIRNTKPDAVILIDYPGFNLRIAKFAKKQGMKVFYYISPQVWAWKSGRVKIIGKYTDRLFVILPFEEEFYKERGISNVEFVGHPLLDVIPEEKLPRPEEVPNPYLLLLPGSRKQEVKYMLPVFLKVAEKVREKYHYDVVIGASSVLEEEFYRNFFKNYPFVKLVYGKTYELISNAEFSFNTSGTVTLETALFGTPQVICYKGNPLSFWIAQKIVNINYIGLPNLIMNEEIVPELIQGDFTEVKLFESFEKTRKNVEGIRKKYKKLREKLGGSGASERVAKKILERL